MMRRREFITLLGGAAAVWPLAARAQQPERMRRIGIFMPGTADNSEFQDRNVAFLQALAEKGWALGRNARFDYRWGAGQIERYPAFAGELVALAPDVILGNGTATVRALQQATRSVPIVFANITDPVGNGLVASLARPGRKRNRFHLSRNGLQREMARIAKGGCTQSNARRRCARFRHFVSGWPVGRHAISRACTRDGASSSRGSGS
jgi:hypothetical protein